MVGTADSVLIREVSSIQCVLYREVPLYWLLSYSPAVLITWCLCQWLFHASWWIQGLPFEVRPSGFAEDLDKGCFAHPSEYVVENARCKAADVGKGVESGVVIGADTVVVSECTVLTGVYINLWPHTHKLCASVSMFPFETKTAVLKKSSYRVLCTQ